MNKILEKGDFIFTRDKTLISKFISFFTGGKSHVMVYDKDGLILESSWYGVVITGLKRYLNASTECTVVKLPSHIDRDQFMHELYKRIGDNYDYGLLFGQLLARLFSFLKLARYDAHTRWLCYEIIGQGLEACGEKFDCPIIELDPQRLMDFYSNEHNTWILDSQETQT